MRNITGEARSVVKGRFPKKDALPLRGSEGCICTEHAPRDEFTLMADASGVIVWYARKSCPIHGLTIQDPNESPPMGTNMEPSTTES